MEITDLAQRIKKDYNVEINDSSGSVEFSEYRTGDLYYIRWYRGHGKQDGVVIYSYSDVIVRVDCKTEMYNWLDGVKGLSRHWGDTLGKLAWYKCYRSYEQYYYLGDVFIEKLN